LIIMDLDSALSDKPAEGATATDILRADHREVEQLFAEIDRAGGEGHARRVAMRTLCIQLELHDALETSVFYPALREMDPQRVGAAERDHDAVRALLEDLRAREDGNGDNDSDSVIEQLRALVTAHVQREENELFPRLERQSNQWLRDLGLMLVKRKEELTGSTEEFEGPAT
jgi:hemerythrin superfamily protein